MSEKNLGTSPIHGVLSDPPLQVSSEVHSEHQLEADDLSVGEANSQVCKCILWCKDIGAALLHIRRLIIRAMFGGIATITLGVLPLSFLTRCAVDDFVEQHGTAFQEMVVDGAKPHEENTCFMIFWAFCYCVHAGFAVGVVWAVVAAWRGWARLTRVARIFALLTFLVMFTFLFSVRVMFMTRHISWDTMANTTQGTYLVWAISAFLMFRHLGRNCEAALLVVVFGITYFINTKLFFLVGSKEIGHFSLITAGLINHALRSLLVECALFAGLRFADVPHGGMTTLLSIAVALSVTVGHAISFCSENMAILLATQALHFTMEISRNYGLLRGQTDVGRVMFYLRKVCSTVAALLTCSLFGASSRRRVQPTSLTPVTVVDCSGKDLAAQGLEGDRATSSEDMARDRMEKVTVEDLAQDLTEMKPVGHVLEDDTSSQGLSQDRTEEKPAGPVPEGDSVTSSEEPAQDHRQALCKQVLADIISIQNIAEIISLFSMACLLPLVKAKLGSRGGKMLPLGLYVLTVFTCELFTDFVTAVVSHRWSQGSGRSSNYHSTTTVWNGEFASTSTQVAALFVMVIASIDSACNLVEALCILPEDGNGGASPLGPCGPSWFDFL